MPENRKTTKKSSDKQLPERDPSLKTDNQAQMDELGKDPAPVGPRSAGQSGDTQRLSEIAVADEARVEELADTDQALESAAVEGEEDAADHPERPTHTPEEYGRPDNAPPRRKTA
jgi:hypothetical protein